MDQNVRLFDSTLCPAHILCVIVFFNHSCLLRIVSPRLTCGQKRILYRGCRVMTKRITRYLLESVELAAWAKAAHMLGTSRSVSE